MARLGLFTRLHRTANATNEIIRRKWPFALMSFERAKERENSGLGNIKLSRMFAALSAANEAVLRAKNPNEMFQMVCDGVVTDAKYLGTAIFLAEPPSPWLKFTSGTGVNSHLYLEMKISTDAASPYGQGLAGQAFRSLQPAITNDMLHDPRTRSQWAVAEKGGVNSLAALPLIRSGEAIGIIYFFFEEAGSIDQPMVQLMQRLADNIVFGLGMFERQAEKESVARAITALSATNEAIIHAKTRAELYEKVCNAAVSAGQFSSTIIALAEQGTESLGVGASAGCQLERPNKIAISSPASIADAVIATAFQTGKPCKSGDVVVGEQGSKPATGSAAGFSLAKDFKTFGALLFTSDRTDEFRPAVTEVLQRITENVALAIDSFDRADAKTAADAKIQFLATHDSLTGLPNRALFNELLKASIESSHRHARQFAILFVDLDRFKIINDTLGHADGDTLLVEIAKRLRANVRASDVVARLGGDEFAILLGDIGEKPHISAIAHKILSSIMKPVVLRGQDCRVTASIGIAMFPENGSDELALMRNADLAMYVVKESGKNDVRFFSQDLKTQSIERLMIESSLRSAVERKEFVLHYQPKRELRTGRLTGVEALLRWVHPELGMLPPNQFISLAEETGLIIPIGAWVLRAACAQNMAWLRQGLAPMSMAVNLSPRQFADANLLDEIDRALLESGMPAELLQLEITESMVMHDVTAAVELLTKIKARGIKLAIDDFGTGYSSMSLLKQFPIDMLKIDRSFVKDLAVESEDRAIADAIIGLGRALGLSVIAEGVETTEQESFLREHSCDEMQGYLFSRPLPSDELLSLLRADNVVSPPLQPSEDMPPLKSRATSL